MKHLKSQRVFENESPDPVRMLKTLKSRGLISPEEYVRDAIELANKEGLDLGDVLEPGETGIFLVPTGGADEDHVETAEDWLRSWRGVKGERVILAEGEISEEWFWIEMVISTGARVKFHYDDRDWVPEYNSIQVGDRTLGLDEETWDDITEEYYEGHDDWERYMHELLSATVALSY